MRSGLQIAIVILLGCVGGPAQAAPDLWQALREGRAVAVMRHAEAPGGGDPPGFRLGDCATQRNLSAAGRDQARRIGDAYRDNGIAAATVLTSAWCRGRDTAAGLGLGPVTAAAPLDSFFSDRGRAEAQTAELRRLIAGLPPGRPAVLVTHQVNITMLSGIYPQSGEAVVLARDGLAVLGRLPPP